LPVYFAALTVGSAWRRTARQRHHRRYTAHIKNTFRQTKRKLGGTCYTHGQAIRKYASQRILKRTGRKPSDSVLTCNYIRIHTPTRLPYLRGTDLHCTNGLPDVPCGQLHIGMWFTTSHVAPWPHVPGQGSAHLFRIHALSLEQSVLSTHSGRQPEYGSPWYSGMHVQTPSRH
jgi:hypothetical protein